MHLFFITISIHLMITTAGAQESLEQELKAVIAEYDIPAMAGLVLHDNQIVEMAAVGFRVRDGDDKVTLRDKWHLGSCTKAMTATLVAHLVERNVIEWDSTISQVLPDMAETMNEQYRKVSIKELLWHRSGIHKNLPTESGVWSSAWKRIDKMSELEQQRLYVKDVLSLEPVKPRGEYLYSNQGYAVAGLMCCVEGKDSFESLMQKELFDPLGMKSAGFGAPLAVSKNQPNGHNADGTSGRPAGDNPPAISAAGRVHATIEDWSKFVAVHLKAGKGRKPFLEPRTFRTMHIPAKGEGTSYAMGWGVYERSWGYGMVLSHTGSNTQWYCTVWMAPKRNFAVLIACNQGGDKAAKACDAAAWKLINRQTKRLDQ